MIAALALLFQAAPVPLPPSDWSTLPALRYLHLAPDDPTLAAFVRSEAKAGRCTAARQTPSGWSLAVDVAVLIQPDGMVRNTLPRAIGCPSVEQYAAGIVFSRARGNVDTGGAGADGWYRTSLAFSWR